MDLIKSEITNLKEYSELKELLLSERNALNPRPATLNGLCLGARNPLISCLISDIKGDTPSLIIVKDEKEADELKKCLDSFNVNSLIYPVRDFVMYNITSSHEIEEERIGVLSAVVSNECDAVITTPDALLQFTMPKSVLVNTTKTITSDDTVDINEISDFLISSGYSRVEMVDGKGQYSLRGGILDVFPSGSKYPVRIELFGDEVDSMSYFDVITQRRTENVKEIKITPSREVLVIGDKKEKLVKELEKNIEKSSDTNTTDTLKSELRSVENGSDSLFLDRFISLIYDENVCLSDYFDKTGVFYLTDHSACFERSDGAFLHTSEIATSLVEGGLVSPQYAKYCFETSKLKKFASSHAGTFLDHFPSSLGDIRLSGVFAIATRKTTAYGDDTDLLCDDVTNYARLGYTTYVMCVSEAEEDKLIELLSLFDISAVKYDGKPVEKGQVTVCISSMPGFELSDEKTAFVSTSSSVNEIQTGVKKHGKSSYKRNAGEKIMSYADLTIGDYIVHEKHGIGKYLGLETITVDGLTGDYVKLQYYGTTVLYIPCGQLDCISKYIGPKSENGTIKLAKIGGTEWGKSKAKVKEAARKMAKELLELYAEREKLPGFSFLRDDKLQEDFEKSFPYDETDSQIVAINEVKNDMETAKPMDRLLCGDVGFGKTEVALRAAFKAVCSGKQVAFLVPTTILAMQHYQTLISRLRGFPVKVEMLSRFRTQRQIKESLRRIKRGECDIAVGTHRILSNDVEFRDLGLFIVDEEQRFGVGDKEKLRHIAKNVDTLTLTATPIPRTLSMAMSGIRDMSVLEEAPGDRVPVHTYVLEYSKVILTEAIRRELRRGGQVFWLKNDISALDETAKRISELVPDARIAVASGKTDKEEMSETWQQMLAGEIDILVCTTIIESGIDIPNANTLIIEDADRFGLSQLHQIRGRVGRSSRHAYAYFTYRKNKVLTDIAVKRLEAIKEYTEFGAGFKVALRDLEIRGAGNILGAEQSGHIENVGYDLYMKLLNEAVLETRGIVPKKKTECTVEFGLNAYIPESYVSSTNQRIEIYKKISLITSDEDREDIIDELIDRYGNPPKAVITLVNLALLRSICEQHGITKVKRNGLNVVIVPQKINVPAWLEITSNHKAKILITVDSMPYATLRLDKNDEPVKETTEIIKEYANLIETKYGGENENEDN